VLMGGAGRAGTANRILEAKEKERAKETASDSDSEDDGPAKKKARRCAAARVDALSHPHSPLILQVLRVKQLLGLGLGLGLGLWIGLGQHVQFALALALRGPSASAPYEPARSLRLGLARAERRAQPGAQREPEALKRQEELRSSSLVQAALCDSTTTVRCVHTKRGYDERAARSLRLSTPNESPPLSSS
jgi:hypothetical protein